MKNTDIKFKIENTIKKLETYKTSLFKKSNENQVIVIGFFTFISIILFLFILTCFIGKDLWKNSNGIWTLITAVFSAPILFIIWRFRDINVTEQIKNQRKDINLKEFQKISEWISAAHFSEKTSKEREVKHNLKNSYLYSYDKRDGEIALQIAAIYNLKPFYTGEYGEEFQKPSLNLLLASWLSLQHHELNKLSEHNYTDNEYDEIIKNLQRNAKSPVGQALTRVLLTDAGQYLKCHPEVFPNLCLAGMDFKMSGVDPKIAFLFKDEFCREINLIGVNYPMANFENTHLTYSKFNGATLSGARFNNCTSRNVDFTKVKFGGADLENGDFYGSIFKGVKFDIDIFEKAKMLEECNFENCTNIPTRIKNNLEHDIYRKKQESPK